MRDDLIVPESVVIKFLKSEWFRKYKTMRSEIGIAFDALDQTIRLPLEATLIQILQRIDEREARIESDLVGENEADSEWEGEIVQFLSQIKSLFPFVASASEEDKKDYVSALVDYLGGKKRVQ